MMTPRDCAVAAGRRGAARVIGLSVPCKELRDRIIPTSPTSISMKSLKKFAGIDFEGLFNKFKLPPLDSDNVKLITVRSEDAQAWANAKVDFAHAPTRSCSLSARVVGPSEDEVRRLHGIDMTPWWHGRADATSKTTASLRADWLLQGAGQSLVTLGTWPSPMTAPMASTSDVSPTTSNCIRL